MERILIYGLAICGIAADYGCFTGSRGLLQQRLLTVKTFTEDVPERSIFFYGKYVKIT